MNGIKDDLRFRSTTTIIDDVDFLKVQLDKIKVSKFTKLVKHLQTEKEIESKEIRGSRVVARTKKYIGASQLGIKNRRRLAFSGNNTKRDPHPPI